jgi:hypothetical protein
VAPVSRWHEGLGDAVVEVDCQGELHHIRWHRGRLRLEDHPDVAAEEVMVVLSGGADRPACLQWLELWRLAVRDGGFLTEWARREEPDPGRRGRHQVALLRLRREGVQDLLPDLEIRRAERMGRVLAHFPPELVERAALAAAQRLLRQPTLAEDDLAPWLDHAVRVRARSAFVRSLAAWRHRARPAALVPFTCRVGGGAPPRVLGRLDGRASWCEVTVDPDWLLEVWARGLAVVDGALVLAAAPASESPTWARPVPGRSASNGPAAEAPGHSARPQAWSILAVDWVAEGDSRVPRLVSRTATDPAATTAAAIPAPPATAGGAAAAGAAQTAISSRTRDSSRAPVSPLSTTRPASSTA